METIIETVPSNLAAAPCVAAGRHVWTLDDGRSKIGFAVRHLMLTHVEGSFHSFCGTVEVDDFDLSKVKVEVTIDAASIDTGHAKRDEHLRDPDFLDVNEYPVITFVSLVADPFRDHLHIRGVLTIRDVSRDIILNVEPAGPPSTGPDGKLRRTAVASTTINRSDYGLTWNRTMEAGRLLVSEEVEIRVEVEMVLNG